MKGLIGAADTPLSSSPADQAKLIRLFLCGDVMTGTREQSGPASSQRSHLARTCIGDARTYVGLAERVNGAIPSPTEFDYIWGRENPSEGTDRGESRNVADGATHQDSIGTRQIPGQLYAPTCRILVSQPFGTCLPHEQRKGRFR